MQTESSSKAEDAKAQAGAVTGTVKDETKNVARSASEQIGNTFQQVSGDVRTRADEQSKKVAQTLHDTGRQLRSMADSSSDDLSSGQQNLAASVVRESADAVERLAGRLDEGGLDAVTADLRALARRRPGAFLFGAAVAGFFAGRIVRNLSGGLSDLTGGSSDPGADDLDLYGGVSESTGVDPLTGTTTPPLSPNGGGMTLSSESADLDADEILP